MKYIRSYSKNESVLRHYNESRKVPLYQRIELLHEIASEIKDMSFELTDEGFKLHHYENKNSLDVSISKGNYMAFEINDIKEYLLRIIDYQKLKKFDITIQVKPLDHYGEWDVKAIWDINIFHTKNDIFRNKHGKDLDDLSIRQLTIIITT